MAKVVLRAWTKENEVILGAFLYSPEGGLGSHMVDLGCQDTAWIDGRKRDVLDDFTTEWERTGHFGHD